MKTCTKCGIEKPESDYSPNGKNGIHTSCKKCQSEYAKVKRLANLEKFRAADRARYEANREVRRAANKAYCDRIKERRSELERARYAEKKEQIKAKNSVYRKENIAKVYAWNGKRRALCRKATPAWANIQEIAAIYAEAKRISAETGVLHHVDHVIPLKGKTVCGLHVETNLTIITAKANLEKGCSH